MDTEHMALTGYMKICIICEEYSNWFINYKMGNPSTGSGCADWPFKSPFCHNPAKVGNPT